MALSMALAGYTAVEADELRRTMGHARQVMERTVRGWDARPSTCGKWIRSAAPCLARSPRRSSRTVVFTFASPMRRCPMRRCPMRRCTVLRSTPASRRSPAKARWQLWGEKGRTPASSARVRRRLSTACSFIPAGAAVVVPDQLSADADTLWTAMAAKRRRLSALRADGTIGDDAFHQIEEELDWAELDIESLLRTEPGAQQRPRSALGGSSGARISHLASDRSDGYARRVSDLRASNPALLDGDRFEGKFRPPATRPHYERVRGYILRAASRCRRSTTPSGRHRRRAARQPSS